MPYADNVTPYADNVTTTMHNKIVRVLNEYNVLMHSLSKCESEMKEAIKKQPELIELYNKFIADVTKKWLLVEYIETESSDGVVSRDNMAHYTTIANPKWCQYFFCDTVEADGEDFFNGKPLLLKGIMLYGFGKAADKYHNDPILKFNSSCLISPADINEIDGRYIITNDSALATSIPSITILSGAELDELQQFLKSMPGILGLDN